MESLLEIQNNEINFIFTKTDKIRPLDKKKLSENIESISKEFNKNIFHTSIKVSNGIVLLKKFIHKSLDTKIGQNF